MTARRLRELKVSGTLRVPPASATLSVPDTFTLGRLHRHTDCAGYIIILPAVPATDRRRNAGRFHLAWVTGARRICRVLATLLLSRTAS